MTEPSSQPIGEPSVGESERHPPELKELLQRCYRYALSLTHDIARAEDLVQDACLAVVKIGGPWARPFLFSIIHNRFVDQFRRSKLVGMEPLDDTGLETADPDDRFWNDSLVASVRGGDLEKGLGRLRSEEREVLYLSAVEGYTSSEIAALWNCPRGTVLSMAHRARHKLRRWLAPQTENEGETP